MVDRSRVLEILLMLFNTVLTVSGTALVTAVSFPYYYGKTYTVFLGTEFYICSTVLYVVAFSLFVIAMGNYVALMKCIRPRVRQYLLGTLSTILMILFVAQLAGGICAYKSTKTAEENLETNMNKTMAGGDDMLKIWARLEQNVQCCGVHGPSDYGNSIPLECCYNSARIRTCTVHNAHQKGCYDTLRKYFTKDNYVGVIAMGLVFAYIPSIIIGWRLVSTLKKENSNFV